MPTFHLLDARENAQVLIRRQVSPGKDVYDPLPYKLVQYDDGTRGIEGICDPHLSGLTHSDASGGTGSGNRGLGAKMGFVILDSPPFSGVTEID